MRVDRANIYCNSGVDTDNYVEIQESDIDYKRATELYDSYPWSDELNNLEENDVSGGIYLTKGNIKSDRHLSAIIYPVEEGKVNIDCNVVLKKGFLGIFGAKDSSRFFEYIPHDEAKANLKELFSYDLDTLYERFQSES